MSIKKRDFSRFFNYFINIIFLYFNRHNHVSITRITNWTQHNGFS